MVVSDGFLDLELVLRARGTLEAWHDSGRLTPAGVGRDGSGGGVRDDHTAWVDVEDPAPMAQVVARFEALRVSLVQELRLGLQRFAVQAARYDGGGGYPRHVDAFRGDVSRVMTALVYLNPDWAPEHGGELRAWTPDGLVDIAPLAGRLALFRADAVPHAVLPSRAPRYALTAWYRGAEAIPTLPDPVVRS